MNDEERYQICINNDSSFDGEFYMGVLTTKIYCLPSCKARDPLYKNVKFFSTREQAISHGLRGCKRCLSEFYPDVQPLWLSKLQQLARIINNRKISSIEIEKLTGVSISTVNRYFKVYENCSFSSYHRDIRLNHAKTLLQNGTDLLDLPYMTGFSSLSGFRSSFKKRFELNPGEVL